MIPRIVDENAVTYYLRQPRTARPAKGGTGGRGRRKGERRCKIKRAKDY